MVTIRELGEKYGGIISEFVARCEEEGLDCETEKIDSEMLNSLISSLKEGNLLSLKQAKYSCSETLYTEMRRKAWKELEESIEQSNINKLKKTYCLWPSKNLDFFLKKSCRYNCLEITEWLLKIGRFTDLAIYNDSFAYACCHGQLEVAKWFLEIKPDIVVYYRHDRVFSYTCQNGHLEVAKWLLEISPDLDVRADCDRAFRRANQNGHQEIVKWLLEIIRSQSRS